jgi:hypothetical protein
METWTDLSYDEIVTAARRCGWLLLDEPFSADADCKSFLVERLRPTSPELAAKVQRLSSEQVCALYEELVECQQTSLV